MPAHECAPACFEREKELFCLPVVNFHIDCCQLHGNGQKNGAVRSVKDTPLMRFLRIRERAAAPAPALNPPASNFYDLFYHRNEM